MVSLKNKKLKTPRRQQYELGSTVVCSGLGDNGLGKRKNVEDGSGVFREPEKRKRKEGVSEDFSDEALVAAAKQPHQHL